MAVQDAFLKANMIYKITKDIDLNKEVINIPDNCTLDFQGGSFRNGTVNLGLACSIKGVINNDTYNCLNQYYKDGNTIISQEVLVNGNHKYINGVFVSKQATSATARNTIYPFLAINEDYYVIVSPEVVELNAGSGKGILISIYDKSWSLLSTVAYTGNSFGKGATIINGNLYLSSTVSSNSVKYVYNSLATLISENGTISNTFTEATINVNYAIESIVSSYGGYISSMYDKHGGNNKLVHLLPDNSELSRIIISDPNDTTSYEVHTISNSDTDYELEVNIGKVLSIVGDKGLLYVLSAIPVSDTEFADYKYVVQVIDYLSSKVIECYELPKYTSGTSYRGIAIWNEELYFTSNLYGDRNDTNNFIVLNYINRNIVPFHNSLNLLQRYYFHNNVKRPLSPLSTNKANSIVTQDSFNSYSIHVDASAVYEGDPTGFSDKPYKTITAALVALSGAGTIVIHEGTYTENLIISDGNVIIQGYDEDTVTIKGYIYAYNSNITLENLTVTSTSLGPLGERNILYKTVASLHKVTYTYNTYSGVPVITCINSVIKEIESVNVNIQRGNKFLDLQDSSSILSIDTINLSNGTALLLGKHAANIPSNTLESIIKESNNNPSDAVALFNNDITSPGDIQTVTITPQVISEIDLSRLFIQLQANNVSFNIIYNPPITSEGEPKLLQYRAGTEAISGGRAKDAALVDNRGFNALIPQKGTTSERPSSILASADEASCNYEVDGHPFYDTTLHKQLYWNNSSGNWVDATGTIV